MNIGKQIWDYIKRANRSVSIGDIASDLDIKPSSVSHHLLRMRKWCVIDHRGHGRASRYRIPPGETYKCPGRGNSPGSRAALVRWDWRKGLEAISERKTRVNRHCAPEIPEPTTTLEACWGRTPSYEKGAVKGIILFAGDSARPQKT